ncbi:dihydrodipicolinate synthase family protein [Conexibacter sp. JD483]|uniref:dihydrodipicolinate synthase family protein n=1 Tax=unclassified Conexibacter TaxID=2627773 RepID=UPI00271D67F4|nr:MULTISPECIES: dihydrodipicolinate synthase family protein [unclassified Conexibacter]MDO8187098.1 dihydrodipicolinate synthase family protein [Conexibacter sp. CPCC 205706]MDO8200956.1 dihydrodipicolinate synthase family protein [Conexibacter sp. CPCC 205762]MDR9371891.1 dihydrodipicolinate synthase family protein [Conexibacter sp. JD483]
MTAPQEALARALPAGMLAAMVTPLDGDGELDLASLDRLVDALVGAGLDGLVPNGSTGENWNLSETQRAVVLSRVLEHAAGRVPVVAGVPPLGTPAAAAEARAAAAAGADAVLVSAPAWSAWSEDELRRHFTLVAEAAGVPLALYEVPTRTNGNTLSVDFVTALAEEGIAHAIKDSSGNLPRARLLNDATRELPFFRRWTGVEEAIDGALLGGADGAVGGLANVAPRAYAELWKAAQAGDWAAAATAQQTLVEARSIFMVPRRDASFTGQAVGALKAALVAQGVIAQATMAAPLLPSDPEQEAAVAALVARLGLEREVAAT